MRGDGYSALLVDDVRELRMLLRIALELSGRFHVVGEAEDGVEAVECAEKHRPDLVILDVSMPVRDGMDALPLVLQASPQSTVVMLSAIEEKRLGRAAVERGAAAYIEKGLEPEQLVHELVRLMDAQRENDAQSMPK